MSKKKRTIDDILAGLPLVIHVSKKETKPYQKELPIVYTLDTGYEKEQPYSAANTN